MMAERADALAVLVVDDHQDTRDILAVTFEEAGYTVFTAPDGESALTCLRTHPTPLVVVLDWRMPGRDGIAVLQAMATSQPGAQRHSYLLLTARPEAARPLLAALPEDLSVVLVGKPFDVDTLLALVARAATQLRPHLQQAAQKQTVSEHVDGRSPGKTPRVRRDVDVSRAVPSGRARPSGTTIGPDGTSETSGTSKTFGQFFLQQQAAAPAADQLLADMGRVAPEHRFQDRIEGELTAELRSRLHLTVSGTSASLRWHGRSFALTYAGLIERTRITPSGGLSAYTLRAWCVTPADNQESRNFAEGELQAGLLDYLDYYGSL